MTEAPIERPDLDKLKARIQAIRSKTTENGCTEHEAMAAAAKVAELLDQYDLSLTDIEIRQDICERVEYETWRKNSGPLDGCVPVIAEFTDCIAWQEANQFGERRYVFFGRHGDVTIAHYICGLIQQAMDTELLRFRATTGYLGYRQSNRRKVSDSFLLGMANSISANLQGMKAQRDESSRATGRDLVVVKAALIEGELAKLGISLRTLRTKHRMVAKDAYHSGHAAGERVVINPGITNG